MTLFTRGGISVPVNNAVGSVGRHVDVLAIRGHCNIYRPCQNCVIDCRDLIRQGSGLLISVPVDNGITVIHAIARHDGVDMLSIRRHRKLYNAVQICVVNQIHLIFQSRAALRNLSAVGVRLGGVVSGHVESADGTLNTIIVLNLVVRRAQRRIAKSLFADRVVASRIGFTNLTRN